MPSSNLTISQLSKRYGDFVALAPTDLTVSQGEFLTLLGPSGSGKTTLLSLIAGLTQPDSGTVLINGEDVTYGAPYERDIGMVFQNYALFPHMTIAENIAFPLKMRKVDSGSVRSQVSEILGMVHLPHVADRFPRELSGGQQQRIALARCMVYKPSIILMDEPLGALDKKLRDHMQLEIKRIHKEMGTTIVYVTHDQEEAMTMSDRICLMNGGAIEQLGTPSDLYFRPRTVFVADFLGESNLLDAVVTECAGREVSVDFKGQPCTGKATAHGGIPKIGQSVKVMLRPQNLRLSSGGQTDRGLSGRVQDIMVTGSLTKLYLGVGSSVKSSLVVSYPTCQTGERYEVGQHLDLSWHAADAVAIVE